MRSADRLTKNLPKAISHFDGKTAPMRPIDLPVFGKLTNAVRQRYVNLRNIQRPPTNSDVARVHVHTGH
jgi:hypothetical protein